MDIDSLRMNYDGVGRQKDLEIAHLRRLIDDQKHIPQAPISYVDHSGHDDTIRKLRANLEDAYV